MTLLLIASEAAKQATNELNSVSDTVNQGIKAFTILAGVILSLIVYIWNEMRLDKRKTDDKVDKLTEQVTILVTLMKPALEDIKENKEQINDMKINCANNGHSKRKTA